MKILPSGEGVILDDEDWELVEAAAWNRFTLRPSMRPCACRKQVRYGREFRILLHREVAIRMRPEIVSLKRKFRVTPKNGDYLDCRRENLEITVLGATRRGRKKIEPRATGSLRPGYVHRYINRPRDPPSELWAGGYEYLNVNLSRRGRGNRIRRCLHGKPID